MAGIESLTIAERVSKLEQRQDDFEKIVDDEVARIRFWIKMAVSVIGTAVIGPLAAWLWPIIREAI
jgi:hypothetical protein